MDAAIGDGGWLLMRWLEHILDPAADQPPTRLIADTRAYLEKIAPGYMEQLAGDLNRLLTAHARVPTPDRGQQ